MAMGMDARRNIYLNKILLFFFFFHRMNSTIIGQRKPKENKRKKKKRTQDRRYSEGEASDYENQLPTACNNNQCQKNGLNAAAEHAKKNPKETEPKNSLIFDIEI